MDNIINENALINFINNEVDRIASIKFEEFKKEFSENYFFDDKLLDKKETANKLDISVRQVDNLIGKGKLKSCALGRSVKLRNSDVLKYMKALK